MTIMAGYIVPGLPQPLLAPEQNQGWGKIRAAFEQARRQIAETEADLLLLYSTQWVSVIGHQIQADPAPEWVHVDQDWHMLGSMPYRFRVDADFAAAYREAAAARGLHARTVAYRGFPIDTGTIDTGTDTSVVDTGSIDTGTIDTGTASCTGITSVSPSRSSSLSSDLSRRGI